MNIYDNIQEEDRWKGRSLIYTSESGIRVHALSKLFDSTKQLATGHYNNQTLGDFGATLSLLSKCLIATWA